MKSPLWLSEPLVRALHDMQISEHGGLPGLRDQAMLESALARPKNLHAYGENDRIALGAAYAFAMVRNHPFVDGNKRTGLLSMLVFFRINGLMLLAPEALTALIVFELAGSSLTEERFIAWVRENVGPDVLTKNPF